MSVRRLEELTGQAQPLAAEEGEGGEAETVLDQKNAVIKVLEGDLAAASAEMVRFLASCNFRFLETRPLSLCACRVHMSRR